MRKGQASQTAVLACILRAAHQIVDHDPKILKDPIAVGLVEGSSEDDIKAESDQYHLPVAKLIRSLFILRNRFTEDQLEIAVKSGVQQYIILGAGLDTFALRQPNWANNLQIIEIDHPDSQQFKLSQLKKIGAKLPDNVKLISANLETESIDQTLDRHRINCNIPTFFSWLGVTQYLSESAAKETLRFVGSLPTLSRISFTIVLPISKLESLDAEVHTLSSKVAASAGEPWVSEYNPKDLIKLLKKIGFTKIIHQTPESASKTHFNNRSDGLMAPMFEQCLCAIV